MIIVLCLNLLLDVANGQECTPNFCDTVRIKCKEAICGPNQILKPRGQGLCDCCPTCVDKRKY